MLDYRFLTTAVLAFLGRHRDRLTDARRRGDAGAISIEVLVIAGGLVAAAVAVAAFIMDKVNQHKADVQ
jgi:hypothetical protein